MTSAIDPTKPADDIPASKADLRTNLAAARSELNHGGFADGFAPSNYGPPASSQVKDHLAALDGALGALSGGSDTFIGLVDTPGAYTGEASKFVKVKTDESGLEFVTSGGATSADAVSYQPPWTGAVSRTVEARLMDEAHVGDFGAAGNGTTDDAAAIQAAVDSPATFIVFGPKSYAIGTRIDIPQGKVLIFKGPNFTAHSSLPTTGDASAFFFFNGNNATSLRGNSIYGMANFNTGGRALYGILVGGSPGKTDFDIYGGNVRFQAGFLSCIRLISGGWYAASIRGVYINGPAANGVAIDWRDSDGTNLLLERIYVDMGDAVNGIAFLLEVETAIMSECDVDQTHATGAAVKIAHTNLGCNLVCLGCHFEGNDGFYFDLPATSLAEVLMLGGTMQAPSTKAGTLMRLGSNSIITLRDVRWRMFTDWSTFADIGSGAILGVYSDQRNLSASSPWNQFTGSGEAYQLYKGKRINLHNSP